MLFTWLMLGGIILLLAPSTWTSNFQFAFLRVFNWPLSVGENISLSARTHSRRDTDVVPARDYRRLDNYCANIEARMRFEQQKVARLSGLPEKFPPADATLVQALVYPATIDKGRGELLIDKGTNYSLAPGHYVLAENSIIGTIGTVSAGGATVRLFTNPESSIPVDIAGIKRLMVGCGDNLAKIPRAKLRPKPGTVVFAAPQPGLLNVPMIIGKVRYCKRNTKSPVLWDIFVEPACDFNELNDVLVTVTALPKLRGDRPG